MAVRSTQPQTLGGTQYAMGEGVSSQISYIGRV